MDTLLEVGLHNAAMAAGLALLAAGVGGWCRRPALAHGLWLLVLLKLITPPLFPVSLLPSSEEPAPPETALAPGQVESKPAQPEPVAVVKAPPEDIRDIALAGKLPAPVAPPANPEIPAPVKEAPPPAAPPLAVDPQPGPEPPSEVLPAAQTGMTWQGIASAVWLSGSLVWFLLALLRIHRFQRLLQYARPAPASLQEETQELALRLGLKQPPEVWLVPGNLSPMLWGLGPMALLLLPMNLLERLSPQQRATVLVHELAHLRRRDHWVRRLELVALGLYWWLPVVWWARRELQEAEEECCDAWVVSVLPDSARSYATALLETVDFLAGVPAALPPAASGVGHVHFLKRRLTMIFRGNTPRALTGAGFLGLVGMGFVLLPLLPTWAQQETNRFGSAGKGSGVGSGDKSGKVSGDLDKIRAEIERLRAELDVKKAELEVRNAEMKQALINLKAAQERLAAIEKDARKKEQGAKSSGGGKGGPSAMPGMPGGMGGFPGMPGMKGPMMGGMGGGGFGGSSSNFEKRLADLEKKMDTLLRELQNLRRDLSRPLVPPPGGGGLPAMPGPKGPMTPGGPGSAPAKPGVPGVPNPPGPFGGTTAPSGLAPLGAGNLFGPTPSSSAAPKGPPGSQ
jgi:beta-lactamase regulating signal transducer with metallopeptidase domain